ncbi:MAG: hypothetical protein FWF73_07175 [Spirochaetes bacterium]|nr:hypothetical protein [Spirochaetota bacterium]
MKKNNEIIEGFKAVEFVRMERSQISNEIQDMKFEELQKYFEQRRIGLTNTTPSPALRK